MESKKSLWGFLEIVMSFFLSWGVDINHFITFFKIFVTFFKYIYILKYFTIKIREKQFGNKINVPFCQGISLDYEKKNIVENFRRQNKHSIRINSMGGLFYGGLLYSQGKVQLLPTWLSSCYLLDNISTIYKVKNHVFVVQN